MSDLNRSLINNSDDEEEIDENESQNGHSLNVKLSKLKIGNIVKNIFNRRKASTKTPSEDAKGRKISCMRSIAKAMCKSINTNSNEGCNVPDEVISESNVGTSTQNAESTSQRTNENGTVVQEKKSLNRKRCSKVIGQTSIRIDGPNNCDLMPNEGEDSRNEENTYATSSVSRKEIYEVSADLQEVNRVLHEDVPEAENTSVYLESEYDKIEESLRKERHVEFHRRSRNRIRPRTSADNNKNFRILRSASSFLNFMENNVKKICSPDAHSGGAVIENEPHTNVQYAKLELDIETIVDNTPTSQKLSHSDLMSGGEVVFEGFAEGFTPSYSPDVVFIDEIPTDVEILKSSVLNYPRESRVLARSFSGGGIIEDSSRGTRLPELFPVKKPGLSHCLPSPQRHLSGGRLVESNSTECQIVVDVYSRKLSVRSSESDVSYTSDELNNLGSTVPQSMDESPYVFRRMNIPRTLSRYAVDPRSPHIGTSRFARNSIPTITAAVGTVRQDVPTTGLMHSMPELIHAPDAQAGSRNRSQESASQYRNAIRTFTRKSRNRATLSGIVRKSTSEDDSASGSGTPVVPRSPLIRPMPDLPHARYVPTSSRDHHSHEFASQNQNAVRTFTRKSKNRKSLPNVSRNSLSSLNSASVSITIDVPRSPLTRDMPDLLFARDVETSSGNHSQEFVSQNQNAIRNFTRKSKTRATVPCISRNSASVSRTTDVRRSSLIRAMPDRLHTRDVQTNSGNHSQELFSQNQNSTRTFTRKSKTRATVPSISRNSLPTLNSVSVSGTTDVPRSPSIRAMSDRFHARDVQTNSGNHSQELFSQNQNAIKTSTRKSKTRATPSSSRRKSTSVVNFASGSAALDEPRCPLTLAKPDQLHALDIQTSSGDRSQNQNVCRIFSRRSNKATPSSSNSNSTISDVLRAQGCRSRYSKGQY